VAGHHIVRSTISGTSFSAVIVVDTSVAASAGSSRSTQMLNRLYPATVYCFTTSCPSGNR
jgi:hypothetical protein